MRKLIDIKHALAKALQAAKATKVVDISRGNGLPGNRRGKQPLGAYPEASRRKLANLTGQHISTISNILQGRSRPKLAVAIQIATALQVDITAFEAVIEQKRTEFEQSKKRRQR